MAIRNYVGARYVPKFADPIGWQANTSYEAMVIVTYNNSSYTSKIPVPPTVGNPAENSKYWALTGNYNAQIEEYRRETADAQEHARDGICAVDEGNNTTAGENHKIGEYFWIDNKLYRATKNISAGDLLSTSNTQETNISEGVYTNYSDITTHINNRSNPHNITKAQIGLGNVDNVSKSDILLSVYRVGSIYISTDSTSPAELFGGTWEQIKDTFLLACGNTYTAGSTGGEAEHKLTETEMPAHVHKAKLGRGQVDNAFVAVTSPSPNNISTSTVHYGDMGTQTGSGRLYMYTDTNSGVTFDFNHSTATTGNNSSHNNMPPYVAVYMWKRVS